MDTERLCKESSVWWETSNPSSSPKVFVGRHDVVSPGNVGLETAPNILYRLEIRRVRTLKEKNTCRVCGVDGGMRGVIRSVVELHPEVAFAKPGICHGPYTAIQSVNACALAERKQVGPQCQPTR